MPLSSGRAYRAISFRAIAIPERIDVIINLNGQLERAALVIGRDISPSSTYPLDHDANEVISEHSEALSAGMLVGRSAKKIGGVTAESLDTIDHRRETTPNGGT